MRLVILTWIALLLAGCGSPRSSEPAAQPAQQAQQAQQPLALLELQGGMKPMQLRLAIEQDGQATLAQQGLNRGADAVGWAISGSQLEQLKALLASPEFAALQDSYLPENTCCDRVEYSLTVATPQGQRVIKTLDGVQNPPALQQALELLMQIQAGAPR